MRYLCIMEIVDGKPRRLLALIFIKWMVVLVIARPCCVVWTGLKRQRHTISCLNGPWGYVAHKPVSGDATISSIQSELE